MDENLRAALKVYGRFLDEESARMDQTVIQAIRTIRQYVHDRDPNDRDMQDAIITARQKRMTSAELESLVTKNA